MEQRPIGAALLEALQRTAERVTDGSSLGLAPRSPLLDTRHVELPRHSRLRFVTNQIAVAQPRARVGVVTQFQVQHDDGPVLAASQALTDSPADQQEFIRKKRSSDDVAKADAVPLCVPNRRNRSQDLKKSRIEVPILPCNTPAIERAQA